MSGLPMSVALMRPRLPASAALLPYLRQIDANRWYSNFGPLVNRFCERLAAFFRKPPECVAVLSSGTAALTTIVQALELPRDSICLLPSWTFAASPASVMAAGLAPFFLDVDADSWALKPSQVREQLRVMQNRVSAVMVVAPFGAPLDIARWDALSEETGVAVIIDAAAGFDAFSTLSDCRPGKSPLMISLHATKVLGIGEGGMVVSDDAALIERIKRISNFGFDDLRNVTMPGINTKMSEYHAAVGLAALDEWPRTRQAWHKLKHLYADALKCARLPARMQPFSEMDWVGSTFNMRLACTDADFVIDRLNRSGIESRKWWAGGCHSHAAYAGCLSGDLPITEALGDTIFALPFTLDMTREDVAFIVEKLSAILQVEERLRTYA